MFQNHQTKLYTFFNITNGIFHLLFFPVHNRFEAMKKDLTAEQERQVKKNDDDIGEPTPAIEDSANTTGSQPLSRAERRPRRVESADVNEE